MTEQTLLWVLGVLGTLITASQVRTWRRLSRAEATNRGLWEYTQLLIYAHYKSGAGPPPPPPDHIKHLYTFGDTS